MYRNLLGGKLFYMYSENTWDFYDPILHEGRLQLLTGMPQNIALLFANIPSESSIFIIQAVIVFLTACFMLMTFRLLDENNWYAVVGAVGFLFAQPFVYASYHPVLTESTMILSMVLVLYFYLKTMLKPTLANFIFFGIFILVMCVAKISSGIILLVVAGSLIVSDVISKERSNTRMLAHGLIIVIVVASILVVSLTGIKPNDTLTSRFTDFVQYTFSSDPLIFLYVIPVGFFAPLYILFMSRTYNSPLQFTALLCTAAAIYSLSLIAFGKHSNYQLAPVYFLATFFFVKSFAIINRRKSDE